MPERAGVILSDNINQVSAIEGYMSDGDKYGHMGSECKKIHEKNEKA